MVNATQIMTIELPRPLKRKLIRAHQREGFFRRLWVLLRDSRDLEISRTTALHRIAAACRQD